MSRRSNIMVAKSLYQMGVVTLLASVVWVMISIYQAVKKPSETAIEPAILAPLSPSLKTEVLKSMTERRQMNEEVWSQLSQIVEEAKREAELPRP